MARMMTLCSLPRTDPGNRIQYRRVNGPYKLVMIAGAGPENKLPYGNLPRLLLAWISTEAVRTQSRVLVLGDSLSEFMRELGDLQHQRQVAYTGIKLAEPDAAVVSNVTVQLVYEHEYGEASVRFLVPSPDARGILVEPRAQARREHAVAKQDRVGRRSFFNEIIRHPVPLDMNTLKALKRSTLGLDLYLWAGLPDLYA